MMKNENLSLYSPKVPESGGNTMKKARRILALALCLVLTGCMAAVTPARAEDTSVNMAVTSTFSSVNPLLIDATETVKHALSLEFLPLMEMNSDLEFVPQLAKEITTEDNLTFTIRLQDNAAWSDGTPVTSKDVQFTFLLLTSPEAGHAILSQYLIVGTDDSGKAPSGATELDGVKIVDEKTVTVTTKWPTALTTFQNLFGRYVFVLPEHILGDIPRAELPSHDWFNHPTVVSGPYFITDVDLNHYVRFTANENYFLGAPKIKYFNMNVTTPAQLLAGLRSGEIDLIQQTTGSIMLEDYEAVRALTNVTAVPGKPITNQSVFFNLDKVPDKRIRQAMFLSLPRELILQELVGGNGEIIDAFLCSASPFYSAELGVTAYDPDKAAQLVREAAADGADTTLTWYVNSGDATFVSAAELTAALAADVGLTLDIRKVDLSTLMAIAGEGDFDLMSVEYTYSPVDPYTDMVWLLSADGWTRFADEDVTALLNSTQSTTDMDAIRQAYLTVNRKVVEEVPMMSAYVISSLGAVSNRLKGATPDVFGTLINVHQWSVE